MDIFYSIYCWFTKLEPAVWIALFALITSIIVVMQNWRHNRLSVIPNLDLERNLKSSPGYIAIISSGIGPAIIEKIEVKDQHRSYDISTLNGMIDLFKEYESMFSGYKLVEKGSYIKPGCSESVLEFKLVGEAKIGNFLAKLSFELIWKSVYGKMYSTAFDKNHGLG